MAAAIFPLDKTQRDSLRLLWRGRDSGLFLRVVAALQRAGIPHDRTRARGYEALPPALPRWALFPRPVFKVCVRPQDFPQATEILRQLIQSVSRA